MEDEHRHRWIILVKSAYAGASHYAEAYCPGCTDRLDHNEIRDRLNEYENMKDYIIEQVGIEYVPKAWGGELE